MVVGVGRWVKPADDSRRTRSRAACLANIPILANSPACARKGSGRVLGQMNQKAHEMLSFWFGYNQGTA